MVKIILLWVFGPEPSLWIIALAIGAGLTMALAPTIRNVRLAHPFFAIAAIWSLGCSFEWLAYGGGIKMRYLLAFIIGGSIFALALATFSWVESNRREHLQNANGSHFQDSNAATEVKKANSPATEGTKMKTKPKAEQTSSRGIELGTDNTIVWKELPTGSKLGNGNTIVGPTDPNGNTIINRGGTAIGTGAMADPTSIAIGAHAHAGGIPQTPPPAPAQSEPKPVKQPPE